MPKHWSRAWLTMSRVQTLGRSWLRRKDRLRAQQQDTEGQGTGPLPSPYLSFPFNSMILNRWPQGVLVTPTFLDPRGWLSHR